MTGPMSEALNTALAAAKVLPRDAATVALARRYAALIDDAQRLSDAAALIDPEDAPTAKRLAELARAVDAQAVVSDLGPKLLAALAALGMTPAARAGGMARGGDSGGRPDSALDELRQRRDARVRQG